MPDFAPGQVVTVFRSRLRPEAGAAYAQVAPEIMALALTMPGLVDVKTFTADDGERVTIVTFEDEASQRAWREHPEHRVAQRRGRDELYSGYSIQVCDTLRATAFSSPNAG